MKPEFYLTRDEWARSVVKGSEQIVHARVIGLLDDNSASIHPIQSFKRAHTPTVLRGSTAPGASCGVRFAVGEEYIYLVKGKEINLCSRLPASKEMLQAIQELSAE